MNLVTIHDEWSYDKNLQYFIGAFIASEGRRLLNDRQFPQQQASSNAASAEKDSKESKKKKKDKSKDSNKKDGDDKKSAKKQYCPFHERETVHKAKDCFLNPKKKEKESANKADTAADKPAVAASTSMENLWCSATFMVVNDAGVTIDINDPSLSVSSNAASTAAASRQHHTPDPTKWMLDSGCSTHMTPCRSVFHKFTPQRMAIHSATGEVFYAKGYGEVAIDLAELDKSTERTRIGGMILDKAWYAPSLTHSLISIKQLAATGTVSTTFYKDHAEMKSLTTGEIKAYATVENNQYWLHTYNGSIAQLCRFVQAHAISASRSPSPGGDLYDKLSSEDRDLYAASTVQTVDTQSAAATSQHAIPMDLAHRRACHAGEARVKKTQDHVEGLHIKKGTILTRPCAPCVQGKGHALPFSKNKAIRTNPGDLLHIDIWGPCSIASYRGYNYYVTFTDDASRFCWVFLIKQKSELLDKFI